MPACSASRAPRASYADEVRSGVYPADEHTYSMPEDELELFSSGSSIPAGGDSEGVEHAHRDR